VSGDGGPRVPRGGKAIVSSGPRARVLRDCLGGDRVVEVELPRPVLIADLDHVRGVGRREVLLSLPRPFFRLDVPGRFLVTGILGETRVRFTVRLAVRDRATEIALEEIEHVLGATT
jgi:hypothetical protein